MIVEGEYNLKLSLHLSYEHYLRWRKIAGKQFLSTARRVEFDIHDSKFVFQSNLRKINDLPQFSSYI